jgi:hypothetical protein
VARDACGMAQRLVTGNDERSKLIRHMDGLRTSWRFLIPAALLATVLVVGSVPAMTCEANSPHLPAVAGEGKQSDNRPAREKCKRAPGSRTVPKGCPEGGERLPNDNNKRSPLDDAPPLTPLVA